MAAVNLPTTVVEYATQAIREGILGGRYPLGSRLDQSGLAAALRTSMIPVREALRRLDAEGLVSISPRRGAFVTGLSPEELREIYLIRESLDDLAVKHAVPNLTARDLDGMQSLLREMDGATRAEDLERLLGLNREFHFLIYRAAGLPRLLQLITNLWDHYSLYARIYMPRHALTSNHDHQAIYDACVGRDAERAAHLTARHIGSAAHAMMRAVGK